MVSRTKNRPFKIPHVVRHVAACLWPGVHLGRLLIARLYGDGKAPETELPPRNGQGLSGGKLYPLLAYLPKRSPNFNRNRKNGSPFTLGLWKGMAVRD